MKNLNEHLLISQVAQRLGVTYDAVLKQIKAGGWSTAIKHHGHVWLINKKEVDLFLSGKKSMKGIYKNVKSR